MQLALCHCGASTLNRLEFWAKEGMGQVLRISSNTSFKLCNAGNIVRAPNGVMHGKTSPVFHNDTDSSYGLLAGLPRFVAYCLEFQVINECSGVLPLTRNDSQL